MTKIIQSKSKASRRFGVTVWGHDKDAFHKKNYRPGQHGASTIVKLSSYGLHLKAKQLLKAHYGRVSERQFRNIFKLAQKIRGNTGEHFIGLLESRLDIVVYRLNLASTIFAARQLVSHGHIQVNGKKVNVPSYRLKTGEQVTVKDSSKQLVTILEPMQKQQRRIPEYLDLNTNSMVGEFKKVPEISEVPYPFDPQVHLVVELYSR